MIHIPQHPRYFHNLEHSGNRGGYSPCVVCGKGIKDGGRQFTVHMWWGTHLVTEQEASELIATGEGNGDMGMFPVGRDCLRRHPELRPYCREIKTLEDGD